MRNDVQTAPPPHRVTTSCGDAARFFELREFEEANDDLWSAWKLQLFGCPSSISLVPLIVDRGASILCRLSPDITPPTNQVNVNSDPQQGRSPGCFFTSQQQKKYGGCLVALTDRMGK